MLHKLTWGCSVLKILEFLNETEKGSLKNVFCVFSLQQSPELGAVDRTQLHICLTCGDQQQKNKWNKKSFGVLYENASTISSKTMFIEWRDFGCQVPASSHICGFISLGPYYRLEDHTWVFGLWNQWDTMERVCVKEMIQTTQRCISLLLSHLPAMVCVITLQLKCLRLCVCACVTTLNRVNNVAWSQGVK